MPRSEVAYQAVGKEGGERTEPPKDKPRKSVGGREDGEEESVGNDGRRGREENRDLKTAESDDADSNNNSHSLRHHNGIVRRTMSFLASLPRKLFSYVREVFYSQQEHRWSRVGNDIEDSEESDWSSSEDGTTTRSAKHKRATTKSRDRHRTNTNKAPPPIAPKPKKHTAKTHRAGSGSSNPPSSPDSNTPDTTPEISFDDIVIESPQLKMYKRIHGPQGRRRPQRYSNQSEIRQSEISLVAENGTP